MGYIILKEKENSQCASIVFQVLADEDRLIYFLKEIRVKFFVLYKFFAVFLICCLHLAFLIHYDLENYVQECHFSVLLKVPFQEVIKLALRRR